MSPTTQPPGTTPGPWAVVRDPWDRDGKTIVGRNPYAGPSGDPHVCPPVATTEAMPLGCDQCGDGIHDPDEHDTRMRADARLIAQAPEMYELLVDRLRAHVNAYRDSAYPFMPASEIQWGLQAAETLAQTLPQKIIRTKTGYVYPHDLSPEGVLALINGERPPEEIPEAIA